MNTSVTPCLLVTLVLSTVAPPLGGNWLGWRGPEGNGVSPDKNLPLKWSNKENVRWRVELPGPGNSSPIVWGDRVFVSQFVAAENRRTLMCLDRSNGKLLWQSGVTYTEREQTQENNPYCAGTPATDGERVYVCFGSPGVYAYDFAGKEVWHRDLGKLNHMFGTAVSTFLQGDLCILNFGPDEKARLVALNKKTGHIAWEAEPPQPDESERQQEMRGFGGRGGPGGGPSGRGGRGGFGPGMMLAPQMLSQGDKSGDQKLTKDELSALAEAWFDKLDADKTGKLSQQQFSAKFGELLPAQNPPPGGGRGGRGGPGGFIGGGLFTATDADKDGSLTRAEFKSAFEKWAASFDSDKSGSLNQEKLVTGLNTALPRPPGGGGRGGPVAPDDNTGFTALFDGKTLNGWDGDPMFWRVEDGMIVAQSTPERRVTENTFLIWRAGKLKDFEIKVDYRFTGNGNSGVQIRSRPSGPGRGGDRPWGIAGYQFDMVTAGGTGSGVIYGEGAGGGFLYGQGTAMRRSADGVNKLIGSLGTGISDIIKGPGEWNTYHIIGRGNQITGFINGRMCAVMIDDNVTSPSYALEGLLALQMHVGAPFRIDFRNIYLKNL